MSNHYRDLSKIAKSLSLSTNIYSDAISKFSRSPTSISALQASLTKQLENDRRLLGSTTTILDRIRQITTFSPDIQALASANVTLTRMVRSVSIADSTLSKIFQDQQRLHATIKRFENFESLASTFSRIDTTRMFSASLLAQKKLAAFDSLSLGSLAGFDSVSSKTLATNFGYLTHSYQSLIEAASTCQSMFKHVPFITTYTPVEYFRETDVLETITVAEKGAEDDDEIVITEALSASLPPADGLLADFNENLCRLLQGARDSAVSSNPDRARHVTTSVRELFTQVVHLLAPDTNVREWSSDPQHFHNNRPTRRARLLYICRHINFGPFSDFVEADVRAILTFLDSLNAGTHVVESRLTEAQLRSIISRIESLLVFLLQIRNTA